MQDMNWFRATSRNTTAARIERLSFNFFKVCEAVSKVTPEGTHQWSEDSLCEVPDLCEDDSGH